MKLLKRIIGILCIIAGPVVVAMLIIAAIHNIELKGKSVVVSSIFIVAVFTPIAIGFMIFGWYAWKGEYELLPRRSEELEY